MRTIKRTKKFKRDYQREKSGLHGKKLDRLLTETLTNPDADNLELVRRGSHSELSL